MKSIHSSLAPVQVGNDDGYGNLPAHPRELGVIAHVGHHRGLEKDMALVDWNEPIISTCSKGDVVEIAETEEFVRLKLFEIAERCREQARELIRHAERLEDVGSREKVIDVQDS